MTSTQTIGTELWSTECRMRSDEVGDGSMRARLEPSKSAVLARLQNTPRELAVPLQPSIDS